MLFIIDFQSANLGSHERKSACQPQGWRTFFDFQSANLGSHEGKSACQPQGWRTFFDFQSAKIINLSQKTSFHCIFFQRDLNMPQSLVL